jgi:hypothetical protein
VAVAYRVATARAAGVAAARGPYSFQTARHATHPQQAEAVVLLALVAGRDVESGICTPCRGMGQWPSAASRPT